MGQSFYQELRTEQQLGYIVFAGFGQIQRTLNLYFLVQSGAHPAGTLAERMDAFIPKFVQDFKALPEKEFERYRQAVIEAKLERDSTLEQYARRIFWIVFRNEENWDYISEDIRAVHALTRAEVEAALETYLLGEGRRRLMIRLVGRDHPEGTMDGEPVPLPPASQGKPLARAN